MFSPIGSFARPARIASLFALILVLGLSNQLLAQAIQAKQPKPADLGVIVTMKHDTQSFGSTNEGQEVKVHTLTNLRGMRVRLIDYGATLINVEVPDGWSQVSERPDNG